MSTHQMRIAILDRQTMPTPRRGARIMTALSARLRAMLEARRSRRALAALDDRTLADIGIGRGQAMWEASRTMWDLAPYRR